MKSKFCPGCQRHVAVDLWGKRNGSPDGLQYRCKRCTRDAMRDHRERVREAEEIAKRRLVTQHEAEFQNLVAEIIADMKGRATA